MDGVINFAKPTGITSARALYKVRAITGQRKSGHAGTLDPAATGVLVLCLGKATKLVESIMDLPKVYRATARLDVTSESFDSDRPLKPVPVNTPPSLDAVQAALSTFEGVIQQAPPIISAVKVGGVPAYKLSGSARSVPLALRPVTIYWLAVLAYGFPRVEFEMCCGRGAYVRSLIRDLGLRLGTGGCLTSLARLRIGPFSLERAWTLESLAAGRAADYALDLTSARNLIESHRGLIPSPPPML